MVKLQFSPKEAIAEAASNIVKAFMIANGTDEQTASLYGGALSGIIKGFSIEKRQSVRDKLDTAIRNAWIDILSRDEFECLEETSKADLKKNVISSQTVFEALTDDEPEAALRRKIIDILRPYKGWSAVELNEYARFAAEEVQCIPMILNLWILF